MAVFSPIARFAADCKPIIKLATSKSEANGNHQHEHMNLPKREGTAARPYTEASKPATQFINHDREA